jgi:hypothetical protein
METLAFLGRRAGYVVVTEVSVQPIILIFKDRAAVRIEYFLECLTTGCPEMSATNYQTTRRNVPGTANASSLNRLAVDSLVF